MLLALLLPDYDPKKDFEKQQNKRIQDRAREAAWRIEWLKELHSKNKK